MLGQVGNVSPECLAITGTDMLGNIWSCSAKLCQVSSWYIRICLVKTV